MKVFFAIMIFLFLGVNPLAANEMKICTDKNFWYPFTLVKQKKAAGLHVSIVAKALESKNYQYSFTPLSWERCLLGAENGEFDAVVSASYKDKRAEYLHYPADAKSTKRSESRISQVEYVVVSSKGDDFVFTGDIRQLPTPVRATKGYSIVDDLIEKGLKVETSKGDTNNLRKLIRDQKGVVITLPEMASYLSQQPRYHNKIKIHSIPVKSKSYYMPFSKKSKVSKNEQLAIWKEIAQIRDNELLVQGFLAELSNEQ